MFQILRGLNMDDIKVLIIEDDKKISRFLELELTHEGYSVAIEHDGRKGLTSALAENFDLVLLDVMLPTLNGFEILRRIRLESSLPVIMLTAKDAVTDRVMGLDTGADDYICKPFSIEELLARVRTTLRKKTEGGSEGVSYKIADLELDAAKHSVCRAGQTAELTKREYDLLKYLIANKGNILSREQILENVWGFDFFGSTNIVDVYIRYLRGKIDDPFNQKLIHTVRGVGYTIRSEHD
jgi:two-component system response regulator ArlR